MQADKGPGPSRDIRVKNLDNEIAAHLAGAIYARVSGQTPSFTDAPHGAAFRIVSNKQIAQRANADSTNSGSPIEFGNAELKPLITAIKGAPLYRDWNQDEVFQWRNS
jgi:hypothetical protein